MRGQTCLIVAEKPTAAQRIAEALDENGSPKKKKGKKVEYYLARRNAEKIIVCPALGHLYTVLDTRRDKNVYPSLVTSWVSRDLAERNSKQIKTWLQDISTASEGAEAFFSACDYDIEGSLIGALVLKYACNGKDVDARRMKFSTLTKNEIISAFEKALPKQDLTLVEAGEARHEVDFLFGINLSRFLTVTHKNNSGKHVTLSVGRVQSPTLSFVVDRDRETKSYVPLPYYEIRPVFQIGEQVIEAEYSEKIVKNKSAAERIISECRDKKGIVGEVSEKTIRRSPPVPFDLGSLQRAAYTHFRFTPSRTLAVLERLYLEALISYPRTGSQKLPEALSLPEKIQSLTHFKEYEALAKSLIENRLTKPNEGKKEDPAHPAVHPTGNVAERALSEDERKIFDLVVKRFLSTFAPSAVLKSTRVTIAVGEYAFRVGGLIVEEEGWMKFLKPYVETDQRLLPQVNVGMAVPLLEITESLKYTSPPPHYNPASLLKVMEENGIGTKATRAETIETLYNRGYIRGEQMEVTPLGYSIIELLNKSSSLITSADMTRDLEEKMSKIELGEMSRQEVLVQSGEIVVNILEDLKKRDSLIAEQLAATVNQTRLEAITVGKCPVCGTGDLRIVRSRRTKKRFIGCSNYWNKTCTNSTPLPQSGQVLRTNRSCQVCSWPMITVKSRGRRPWNTCINPNCASKLRVKEKKRELLPEIEKMQGNPGGAEEEVSGTS